MLEVDVLSRVRSAARSVLVGAVLSGVAWGCAVEASEDAVPETEIGTSQEPLNIMSRLCGGAMDKECSDGLFCVPFLARGCPGPRRIGVCLPKPRSCPPVSQPVCGCDGNTYENLCEASAEGVSVEHHGACDPSGEPACGGEAGDECAGAGTCVDGLCVCGTPGMCGPGQVWNGDATVCGCVPNDSATCDDVICMEGEECVDAGDGTVACVPISDACDGIECMVGEECVVDDSGSAACVPVDPCDGVTCMTGEVCVDGMCVAAATAQQMRKSTFSASNGRGSGR